MMKITNERVYGLEESIIASGYPMMVETPDKEEFEESQYVINCITQNIKENREIEEIEEFAEEMKYIDRAENLGKASQGSGHSNFLLGIIVQADFTAPQYWWMQHGRYHFSDIVSSQSKMHRLTKMDIDKQCNRWVDSRAIEALEEYIDWYNDFDYYKETLNVITLRDEEMVEFTKENLFHLIISNCPMGLNLTARITDNYLSLKTQYMQRKNHPTLDWREDWCKWVLELPYFRELTGIE